MIEKFLSQGNLVQNVQTISELNVRVDQGGKINIMMGQTFDQGQPVDMLKYGLFMMTLSDLIAKKGAMATPKWLIADHFMTNINKDTGVAEATEQADKRIDYLNKMNNAYGGNITSVLSSNLSQQETYGRNLDTLMQEANQNSDFKEKVLLAVPEDRRSNPDAYTYPFEELATIQTLGADIKVGPPYERFYDEPAREIAPMVGFNRYVSIQLTKAFPFGDPNIPANTAKEIEEFGLLPYKKESKGLGGYRIDPISDSIDSASALIISTTDRRAVVDLMVITELARQRLTGQSISLEASMKYGNNFGALKEHVAEAYLEYVYKPLHTADQRSVQV